MIKKFCRRSYIALSITLFKAQRFCLRHCRWVSLLFLISSLLVISQAGKMKIIFTAEDMAGEELASGRELKSIKERFRDGETSTFLLKPQEGRSDFSLEELCQIRDWYATLRITIPEIKMTASTFDFKWPVATSETRVAFKNLLDLDCRQQILHQPLAQVKEHLNSSPFGLAIEKQKNMTLVFQFIFHDSTTSKFGAFDPKLTEFVRDSLNKELLPRLQGAEVSWVGPADYQWYVLEGFKFSKWVNLSMFVVMLLLLRLFLGTWKSGFLYSATVFLTAGWVFGLKGLFNSYFDVLSTGLILMIGISSLEDFVFVSGEMMKGYSWRKSMRRILVPGTFTSLTTVIGFLASCVSDIEAISRMGFWTGLGGLIECGIIFFALPALLKTFSYQSSWVKPNPSFQSLDGMTSRALPKYMGFALCLVFPLGFAMMQKFNYNESPQNVFPENQEYRVSLERLKESKNWQGTTSLLYDVPLNYQEADEILKKIEADPWVKDFVVAFESPQRIINWIDQQKVLPLDVTEVQFNISALKKVYVDENDYLRAILYVKDSSVDNIKALRDKVKESCAEKCHLGGELVAYSDFTDLVPRSLINSLLASLFFVSLVIIYLALAMNKEKDLLQILLASYWGPFFMIMILGMLHARIDFWKSIFASILVGLAGDNAIQYIEASRHKSLNKAISDRGASSILTALVMSVTALCYLGSYFSSPRVFGVILLAGLIAGLVGELWLLNSLLASKDKSKID